MSTTSRITRTSPSDPRWPPRPFVETERASLRREMGYKDKHPAEYNREAINRGTIDQDPIIMDPESTPSKISPSSCDRLAKPRSHEAPKHQSWRDKDLVNSPPASPYLDAIPWHEDEKRSSTHQLNIAPSTAPKRSFTAGDARPVVIEPTTTRLSRPQLRVLSGSSRRHTESDLKDAQDISEARSPKIPPLLSPSCEPPMLSPNLLSSSIPLHQGRESLLRRAPSSRPHSPAPPTIAGSSKTNPGGTLGGVEFDHGNANKAIHRARSPVPMPPVMLSSADSSFPANYTFRSFQPQISTPSADATMGFARKISGSSSPPTSQSLLSANILGQSPRPNSKSPAPRTPLEDHHHSSFEDLQHTQQRTSRHTSRNSSIDDTASSSLHLGGDSGGPLTPRGRRDSGILLSTSMRSLPVCRRSELSAEHRGWLTIRGCAKSAVCPSCYRQVIVGTRFQHLVYPMTPQIKVERIRCSFSDAWLQLAWLLTIERQSADLGLLASLKKTDQGSALRTRNDRGDWYTLSDELGRPLDDFAVCPSNLDKLYILLPDLRGKFRIMPDRASVSGADQQQCALRPDRNNRFTAYMEKLIYLHETARLMHRAPDLKSFALLVKAKLSISECARDDLLSQTRWHYIPALLPAFTICADCYMDCVLPHVPRVPQNSGSGADTDTDLASSITSRPFLLPAWANEAERGSSCQLYSARMRDVWSRALSGEGMKLLARKAKQRKADEDRLQDRACSITARLERLTAAKHGRYAGEAPSLNGSGSHEEIRRLSSQLEELTKQWLEVE